MGDELLGNGASTSEQPGRLVGLILHIVWIDEWPASGEHEYEQNGREESARLYSTE